MKALLAVVLFCSMNGALSADQPATLHQEIAALDSALFDAFNKKDLDGVQRHFSRDLEFYHDKGGFSNYEQNQITSKRMFEQNKTLKRTLVAGTMKVYPIKNFGAIQTADHQFCNYESGREDCAVFKFLHIWQRTDAGWRLSRVVSYDH